MLNEVVCRIEDLFCLKSVAFSYREWYLDGCSVESYKPKFSLTRVKNTFIWS